MPNRPLPDPPFMAEDTRTGRLLCIHRRLDRNPNIYVGKRGYYYPAEFLNPDLTEYARRQAEAERAQAETHADALV